MEIEIIKIKTGYDEAIAKHKNEKEKFEFVAGELTILIRSFMDAVFLLPKNLRKEIIDRMGEGTVKQGMKKLYEESEEREKEVRIKALSEAFLKSEPRQGIPERNKKGSETD